jgi:thymidylate synthase (FAD)
MNRIEVAVLDNGQDPGGMMMFLAKLTQRGHNIKDMSDLMALFENSKQPSETTIRRVAKLPHGTIKRFCPITIAIVGASRRFLAQARTHQVGFNYVSASLQYSDYSGEADFVVPYALLEADQKHDGNGLMPSDIYLTACVDAMDAYSHIASLTDNDTAGYAAPQGLRNILIMQANHESWMTFINKRGCNRNTVETQYVTMRIWEELLKTPNGEEFLAYAGPDCMYSACREGKMCCGKPLKGYRGLNEISDTPAIPRLIINDKWPLLK